MKYPDGQEVRMGDRVGLGDDREGIVVCSIDTDEYSDAHPREQWAYLKTGAVIEFPSFGLIHYETAEDDLQLIRRA
ncbi:hypothetical protein [uncultured Sneathiella sp.]|uniref:hypothetical protein n=1 Tax=uncultured Sneathiella sp. TaxID=879315 RepID=UPI0030D80B20